MISAGGLLWVLLALATTTFTGLFLARFLTRDLEPTETFAWSFTCGLVFQALLWLAFLIMRVPAGPKKMLAADAIVAVVAFGVNRRLVPISQRDRARASAPATVLMFLATACLVLFAVESVAQPMSTTDYLGIWGFKAKIIFETGAIPSRLFHDPALFWSHPEYPLLPSLMLAALARTAGGWNDQALAIVYPAFQAATVLAVFGFLARRRSTLSAAAAACLTACFFPLYSPVNIGTAEIPLALGIVLLCSAVLDFAERDGARARVRVLVASLFCAGLKQEGTLFAVLVSLALVPVLGLRKARIGSVLLLGPALLNAVALRAVRGPVQGRDLDLSLLSTARWPDLGKRLSEMVVVVGQSLSVRALVILAATLGILLLTRRTFADFLLLPLAAQLLAYLIAMSLSAFGVPWLVRTALGRITSVMVPAVLIVVGARIGGDSRKSQAIDPPSPGC